MSLNNTSSTNQKLQSSLVPAAKLQDNNNTQFINSHEPPKKHPVSNYKVEYDTQFIKNLQENGIPIRFCSQHNRPAILICRTCQEPERNLCCQCAKDKVKENHRSCTFLLACQAKTSKCKCLLLLKPNPSLRKIYPNTKMMFY